MYFKQELNQSFLVLPAACFLLRFARSRSRSRSGHAFKHQPQTSNLKHQTLNIKRILHPAFEKSLVF